MCALHYATTTINNEKSIANEQTQVAEQVSKLDQLLADFFSK